MYTVALVDDDPAFEGWLRATCDVDRFRIVRSGPDAVAGDLVLWNLSRFPRPPKGLLRHLRVQDGDRQVIVIWDGREPAEPAIQALRAGALEATGKPPLGGELLEAAFERFHRLRIGGQAEDRLLQSLVDRTYCLSLVNEVLQGINASGTYKALGEATAGPLVELTGAWSARLLLPDDPAAPALPEVLPVGEVVDGARTAGCFQHRVVGTTYVGGFPLVAQGAWVGTLILVGDADLLPQLELIVDLVQSLCGPVAAAASAISRLEEARRKAARDALTGLLNREALQRRLAAAFDRTCRLQAPNTVVMIDLDHFKAVNDRFGHPAGDRVLVSVGRLLEACVRGADTAARFGGEEFAVVLEDTAIADAAQVAERLRDRIQGLELTAPDGRPLGALSASFGLAQMQPGDAAGDDALRRADEALYEAKRRGRNRVHAEREPGGPGDEPEVVPPLVRVLSEVLEARDGYTGHHSQQLSQLARAVAFELGLSRPEVDRVTHAGMLHDLGKIAVPDAILRKAGPLTDAEWAAMRSHPAVGARILKVGGLHALADAIHHHHERWDGTGYPDGLAADAIPAVARVVAVLDAWGAMTEDRPYRKAIGTVRAREELARCAGTQFDPAVVAAVFRVLDRVPEANRVVVAAVPAGPLCTA